MRTETTTHLTLAGVLVIGVDDKVTTPAGGGSPTRLVSACTRFGQQALNAWAKDVVLDMAPYFSPLPRFVEVDHDGKGHLVLVAVVPRAPALIPTTKQGRLVYPIRIGDSTVDAPEYMAADLILGRRNRPVLRLRATPDNDAAARQTQSPDSTCAGLKFEAENVSLVPATRIRMGVVYWSRDQPGKPVSDGLKHMISIEQFDVHTKNGLFVRHQVFDLISRGWAQNGVIPPEPTIEPFSVSSFFPQRGFALRGPKADNFTWHIAVYLHAEGTIPDWFQLTWTSGKEPDLRPLFGELPRVDWEAH